MKLAISILMGLKELKILDFPLVKTDFAENIFWVFGIVLEGKNQKNFDKILDSLKKEGIGTRPFFLASSSSTRS